MVRFIRLLEFVQYTKNFDEKFPDSNASGGLSVREYTASEAASLKALS